MRGTRSQKKAALLIRSNITNLRPREVTRSIVSCPGSDIKQKLEKERTTIIVGTGTMSPLCHPTYICLSEKSMIEIEYREFHGDRRALANYLREKLKTEVQAERKTIRIGSSDKPNAGPSTQEVRDLVKRALHHIGADDYHVVTRDGVLSIRERKTREHYAKRKEGSVPSVRQTVPYFFPG
jgi:hypothetical protein